MATLIPARSSCLRRMTQGEKRFSERLEKKLEDDYLLWYDVPIGLKQRQPDFVVLHPGRGLLVLEVKDWKLETIQSADRNAFTLITERGLTRAANPLLQARACALEIAVVLERDPALRHDENSAYRGKLALPWGFGVVLTNITRKQFQDAELNQVIQSHLVICQDEMYGSVDAEAFQERLWAMFPQPFPCALTLPQVDRVRWHLFPEIRVTPGEGQFGLFEREETTASNIELPDLVRVMDMQQEQLARSLGDGHRIIHGVAGSGKTMILGYRCVHLARALNKPILVLCFNRALAARLRQLIAERGLSDKVNVRSFHAWCRQMLALYHVAVPKTWNGYASAVMQGVENGRIPRAQYGAVLIDEGHDFQPDWYRLVVQMVDPSTRSLLILYDDAQDIYGKRALQAFTWKSVGVEAVGHTTILKLNYRNTLEILSVARHFAADLLEEHVSDDDNVPLIAPESAGRRGDMPRMACFADTATETAAVIDTIGREHARGTRLSDIAVIFHDIASGRRLGKALSTADIAHRVAIDPSGKDGLFDAEDSVKLVTMHSSKGLEFPVVIIVGIDDLATDTDAQARDARLLYVAMTRAADRLTLLHRRDSPFSRRLQQSIDAARSTLGMAA